jgi:hypothetical protein
VVIDMPLNTQHKDQGYVRYDVVAGPGGVWMVRRDGCTLARRSTRVAAKLLATHMAWREASHRHVQTVVHCECWGGQVAITDDEAP